MSSNMSPLPVNGATTNGATTNGSTPKITFYTNHRCPWAHRANITLHALSIPYEEVIIDLDTPRPQWYLDINPRGLVPALRIDNEIIYESAIVATFLADAFPHPNFYPPSNDRGAAMERAKVGFFVDTFFGKVNSLSFGMLKAPPGEEQEKLGRELVGAVEKEVEPLLEGVGPFLGGSKELTLAEALTGPFVLRYKTYAEHGLMPKSVQKGMEALPNYGKWSKAICEHPAVLSGFDGPVFAEKTKEKIEKMKAGTK